MKKIFTLSSFIFLFSCNPSMNYYQIYETEFDGSSQNHQYEDENIIVKYEFWGDKGSVSFTIFNKTKNDLIIDLQKSFFVKNNYAKQYFQNRTFHYDGYKVNTTPEIKLYNSYSLNEFPLITIPSETRILISEFNSVEDRYINCDLEKYPTKKQIKTITFSEANSPFKYSNIITYVTKNDTVRVKNDFHVIKVTNYPESVVTRLNETTPCGNKLEGIERIRVFNQEYSKPNNFYYFYSIKTTSFIN